MAEEQGLDSLEQGEKAVVLRVKGGGHIRKRLMDMGMTPGSVVEMVRRAPLGDPIVFKLKGYLLTMRKTEAELVIVRPEEAPMLQQLSLFTAPGGTNLRVTAINAGRGLARRLAEMGLTENTIVNVTGHEGRGKMAVRVTGSVILLSRGMAMKVMVKEILN